MSEYSTLQTISDLDAVFSRSHERPVILFKHSLTCPISGAAFSRYRSFLDERPADDRAEYTLIEVQNAREVSNEIAQRTGVRHESPQAILLRGGEATWHASHGSIRGEALSAAVAGSDGPALKA